MVRYFLLYIVALVGMSLGSLISGASFLTPLSLALLLFGILGLWLRDNHSIRELGFNKSSQWFLQLLVSTLIGVAIVLLLFMIFSWSSLWSITPREGIRDRLPQMIFSTLIFTLLIAASEEIIFRGGYHQVFKRRYNAIIAAGVSALLWAVIHLPAMAGDQAPVSALILGMLTFFGFGIFLSFSLMIAGGSLWVPIGIHYGYNLAWSAIGAIYSVEITGTPLLVGSSGWVPETGLVGAIAWLGLAFLLGYRGRDWINTSVAHQDSGQEQGGS